MLPWLSWKESMLPWLSWKIFFVWLFQFHVNSSSHYYLDANFIEYKLSDNEKNLIRIWLSDDIENGKMHHHSSCMDKTLLNQWLLLGESVHITCHSHTMLQNIHSFIIYKRLHEDGNQNQLFTTLAQAFHACFNYNWQYQSNRGSLGTLKSDSPINNIQTAWYTL